MRLLRLFRLPRLAQLLDVEKAKSTLNEYYGKKLERSVVANDNEFSFPIMRVIMAVHTYNLFSIIIVIFTISYFLGIFWLIYVRDIEDWQNPGTYDVYYGYRTFYSLEKYGFITDSADEDEAEHVYLTLVKMWYYAITTLSTIGFGDFSPKSVDEKLIGSFILLFGVVVFSIIMSKLIDILVSFKAIDQQGQHKDLSKWIAMLSKYNGGHPMKKEIIASIEGFFDFYWSNNKMLAFQTQIDKRLMQELPENVTQKIYIDYVFQDFAYKFSYYFRYRNQRNQIVICKKTHTTFRQQIVKLLKELQPRRYQVGGNIIQDQHGEVFEAFFIMKGKVGVGYRLFNEVFMGLALKERQVVNDYAIIHNKVSEFLYQPIIESAEGLALKRSTFIEILKDNYWKRFLPQWTKEYQKKIQQVVTEHRREMATKFRNRIDYVDLGAFGVNINEGDNITDLKLREFNTLVEKFSGIGLLNYKLSQLDKKLDELCLQMMVMAIRYDRRIDMFFGKVNYLDDF